MLIRKAREEDRENIAKAMTLSFQKIFSIFTKDMDIMAKVFERGIVIERFFVGEENGEILGIAGIGDNVSRAISSTKEECVANLGRIRGGLAFRIIKKELMRPHPYPETTGYFDIVGVVPQARGKGVAKELMRETIANNTQYEEFILDVDSANTSAIAAYTKFGFVEYKRERVIKISKRAKIFMRFVMKHH